MTPHTRDCPFCAEAVKIQELSIPAHQKLAMLDTLFTQHQDKQTDEPATENS